MINIKSIKEKAENLLYPAYFKKDKRGVMGLDVAKSFLLILLGLVVIGVVFIIVLNELGDTSIIVNENDTQAIINNATRATSDFFSNTGTWLSLLSVVIIILIVSAVILVINRFGGGGQKS